MTGHSQRVSALSWNGHVATSGSRSGMIYHHDVRIPDHLIATLAAHTQEVCGLKWSGDGRYLASGGNDNRLHVWPTAPNDRTTPLHTFTDHQAAVKALDWCPWQPNVLASGGGTADRHIRLWNCDSGQPIAAIDAESQVCSVFWSAEYRELVSGHGYPSHQLCIWKYPKMNKIAELLGHTARVLNLAMSPCGEYVTSASADESLRIWHCFAVDPLKKKSREKQLQQHQSAKKSLQGRMATMQLR